MYVNSLIGWLQLGKASSSTSRNISYNSVTSQVPFSCRLRYGAGQIEFRTTDNVRYSRCNKQNDFNTIRCTVISVLMNGVR
jgi:hypothetical protein